MTTTMRAALVLSAVATIAVEAGSPSLEAMVRAHGDRRLSIVNFDNTQHGANENLRIKNLWEGIDSMVALLTMK